MNLIFILFLIYLKIQNGEESFFKIKNIASDYCIDANSASVFTNDCNFLSKTQKWIILMDSETLIHGIKVYQFVNSATSLCLDSDNSNKKVFLNECNKLKYSQNWSLLMQNAINSLCLEGNLDNSLNINNCDKSSFNQKWLLQKEDKINPLETTTNLVKFNSVITIDITTSNPDITSHSCNWIGHCVNDPCVTYDDCDVDWICKNNKCAKV